MVFLLAISRLTSSSVLPYHGVTVGITPHSAPVHSQYFHEQDKYGQYVYGYSSGLHAKDELKTADGITRGGYSYIDANGILQTVQYISDPIHGFRVKATNIPHDLPEVAAAKAQHYHNYETIKAEHAYIAAIQRDHAAISLSPLPPRNSFVVPIRAPIEAPIYTPSKSPIPYDPHASHYIPIITKQYHAQDNIGQYSYGYAGPLSSKTETKTSDGITRGGYSYLDANGILQSVKYISDPVNGFRVQASNLPVAPQVTLVGPKVSASVIGPKDQNTIVQGNAPSEIHSISVEPGNIPVVNPQPVSGQFVNPVILSSSEKIEADIPNSQVYSHDIPFIGHEPNPIFTQPSAVHPIHTIPFHGNGRIVTHEEQINNQNIPRRFIYHGQANPEIAQEIVYHGQNTPNYEPAQVVLPPNSPQVYNSVENSFTTPQPASSNGFLNSYEQFNHHPLPQSIQTVHQPIANPEEIYIDPSVFATSKDVNPSSPSKLLINNPVPNYQIPINSGVGSEAISRDLINRGEINQKVGIYQEQGEFLRSLSEEQEHSRGGSIRGNGGSALFVPIPQHVQQVPQTPVNAVRQQQALYSKGNIVGPLSDARDNNGSGYDIQGPTGNPNIQPSGYYTQNIQY